MNDGLFGFPSVHTGAQAWVNFGYVNSQVVVRASFNVASVVRVSAGVFTITFRRAMGQQNFCVVGSCTTSTDVTAVGPTSMSQTSVTVTCKQVGVSATDPQNCCVAVFA